MVGVRSVVSERGGHFLVHTIKMFLVLFFIIFGFLSAAQREALPEGGESLPPYRQFCETGWPQRLQEHDVIVQYRSPSGERFHVTWNVLGLMYSAFSAVESVLERNFVKGGGRCFVSGDLGGLFQHMKVFVQKNKQVHYQDLPDDYQPLKAPQAAQMFPSGEHKVWKSAVLPSTYFEKREFRVFFVIGRETHCLRCLPSYTRGCGCMKADSALRYAFNKEVTHDFQKDLRERARRKRQELADMMATEGSKVIVRYRTPEDRESSAVWSVHSIISRGGIRLKDLLLDAALHGMSIGYKDNSVRHYAFVGGDLCKILRKELAADIAQGSRVTTDPFKKTELLSVADAKRMQNFTWQIVEGESSRYPQEKGACTLTYAGITLVGMPLVCGRCCEGKLKNPHVTTGRNFLRGLDEHPQEVAQKYCFRVYDSSRKLLWT